MRAVVPGQQQAGFARVGEAQQWGVGQDGPRQGGVESRCGSGTVGHRGFRPDLDGSDRAPIVSSRSRMRNFGKKFKELVAR